MADATSTTSAEPDVDTTHEDYDDSIEDWELLDDLYDGERIIKNAGTKYLPRLGGQDVTDYDAYKLRGDFFNAFARTLQGLVGSVFRKEPDIEVPDTMTELTEHITRTGKSLFELAKDTTLATLKKGRCGLLVDRDGDVGEPYIAFYGAKSILNWDTELIEGRERLTLLSLAEDYIDPESSEYSQTKLDQVRVYKIIDEQCSVEVYVKFPDEKRYKLVEGPTIIKAASKSIDYIPFVIIGPDDTDPEPNKPTLLDLAYINISHWRKSVDLAHGLHFCALPTPWAAGFNTNEKLYIGPTHAWVSEEADAKCGYLEFTGAGLKTLMEALERSEKQMAALGARLISDTRAKIETAETARIHQQGDTASLVSIARTISKGLTIAVKLVAIWSSIDEKDIRIELNKDFVDSKLTPQEISSLVQALQTGSISQDTFLHNMKEGEVLPPGREIEDEQLLIDADDEKAFRTTNDGEPDPEDDAEDGEEDVEDDEENEDDG